jgi:hypothetical protein
LSIPRGIETGVELPLPLAGETGAGFPWGTKSTVDLVERAFSFVLEMNTVIHQSSIIKAVSISHGGRYRLMQMAIIAAAFFVPSMFYDLAALVDAYYE